MNQENRSRPAENKMGIMPVNKLILNMSLPMMLSMLVQALYNVVDSIFVAMIHENALTAVSLAFPIQNLMIAAGAGTGVGVNAVLSKALGERNFEKADTTANNSLFLAGICYAVFLVTGLFFITPFYQSQTSDAQIIAYGQQYCVIICCFSAGIFLQIAFERLLQSTGKTFYTMIVQGMGAVINLILDPILIFGLFGFPGMGVAGAAVATVTGQIIAGVSAFFINRKVNHEIHLNLKGFRPDMEIIKHIYAVGIPTIIMQAIGSVMLYGLNRILIVFTSTATAVLGVYFKLQSFIFMPVFGLNNGMVPIIAYNYGADSRERVVKTIRYSICYAVGIMLAGFLIFQIFPRQLLYLFSASETMLAIGVPALRIISFSFILAGYCIVCGSVYQALGNGVYSMLVSIARQLVVLLPASWLLAQLGNVNLVWWGFPIAEIISFIMSTYFLIKIYKGVIQNLS